MKRITYLATVSQLLSLNNTSMRFILPSLIVLLSGLSLSLSAQTVVDFTTMNDTQTWGTHSQKDMGGGVWAMWGGDVDGDGIVSYDGTVNFETGTPIITSPGRLGILNNINSEPGTNGTKTYVYQDYNMHDIDLDGLVSYDGSVYFGGGSPVITSPGRLWLLNQINTHPNTNGTKTFTFKEQLP